MVHTVRKAPGCRHGDGMRLAWCGGAQQHVVRVPVKWRQRGPRRGGGGGVPRSERGNHITSHITPQELNSGVTAPEKRTAPFASQAPLGLAAWLIGGIPLAEPPPRVAPAGC